MSTKAKLISETAEMALAHTAAFQEAVETYCKKKGEEHLPLAQLVVMRDTFKKADEKQVKKFKGKDRKLAEHLSGYKDQCIGAIVKGGSDYQKKFSKEMVPLVVVQNMVKLVNLKIDR